MHQMMPPAKFTGTKLTLKRFLAFVDEHVSLELIRIGESRRAQLTGVWTFARMDPQVAPQIGHLDKLAIAVRAVVRLLARVQAHVRLEVMIASESFAALLTLERLLARVGPFVILQDVLVAERPMTNGTAKHLVTLLLLQRSRRQRNVVNHR
jgi:hypothetical protein